MGPRDINFPPDHNASSVLFHENKETSDGNEHARFKEEDVAKCEWLSGSILLLDDHLCFSSVPAQVFKTGDDDAAESHLSASSSTSKQKREEQSEILQFIQSMCTL